VIVILHDIFTTHAVLQNNNNKTCDTGLTIQNGGIKARTHSHSVTKRVLYQSLLVGMLRNNPNIFQVNKNEFN